MLLQRCSSEPTRTTSRCRRTGGGGTTSLAGDGSRTLQTANVIPAARSSSNNNNNSNNLSATSAMTTTTTPLVGNNPNSFLPGASTLVVDIVWPVIHPPMTTPHNSSSSSSSRLQCAGLGHVSDVSNGVLSGTTIAPSSSSSSGTSETFSSSAVLVVEEQVQQIEDVSANDTSSSSPSPRVDLPGVAAEEEVPAERRVCRGVTNTAPTTPALTAPPPRETSSSVASVDSADSVDSTAQESPARDNVPRTAPGTCVVCFAHSEEIVGAAWLHRESTAATAAVASNKSGETGCMASACVSCLKTYFEGIVMAGFDGACPRMRCMCCPRVVCQWAWAPLVDPEVLETFKQRAATLLSLQCGSCHLRGSVMVVPPADHSYSLALDSLMTGIAATPDGHCGKAKEKLEDSNNAKDNGPSNARIEAFRFALGRYISGEDVDVVKIYDEVEAIFSLAFEEDQAKDRYSRMVDVLRCVEDNERRASLHIRFLRFHPMMETACCNSLHCFRCRVQGGHPRVTCEQYEAQRGHEYVYQCPGCGVYVVKGDGCNAITCVCGASFNWDVLTHERNVQAVSVFRAAHVGDPARAAAVILRQDSLGFRGNADDDEVAEVDEAHGQTGEGVREDEAASPVAHEPHSVEEAVQDTPLLAPGSALEVRLARLFATTYPRDIRIARAAIFGEENPHFTAHRALHQAHGSSNGVVGPLDYFGRAPTRTVTPTGAELAWEATSASNWLHENTQLIRSMQQRQTVARLSLVEAFYGNETSGDNIAHVHAAAEHSRYAIRAAAEAPDQEPLFGWLGIGNSAQNENTDAEGPSSQTLAFGNGETPAAPSRISEENARPLLPPAVVWGRRPPRRLTPPRATCPLYRRTRRVSAVSSFGSQQLGNDVFTWLADSEGTRRRLHRQMALEEDRLSQAWVALWGRRNFFGAEKMSADDGNQGLENQRAVQMAARRIPFLEIYPEHSCAEQAPMLKAFVRRHWAEAARARASVTVQRAAAWEAKAMHSPSWSASLESVGQGGCTHENEPCSSNGNNNNNSGSSDRDVGSCYCSQSFKRGYGAYLSHVEKESVADDVRRPPLSTRAGGKRGGSSGGVGARATVEQRYFECLASAWEVHNRRRIEAVRFADTHAERGAASVAAVLALAVVPVLVKGNSMCGCELKAAAQGAACWQKLNREAYGAEFARLLACKKEGTRFLEGCECKGGSENEACKTQIACPVLARRLLRAPKPLCNCAVHDIFHFEDGFLSSLFG